MSTPAVPVARQLRSYARAPVVRLVVAASFLLAVAEGASLTRGSGAIAALKLSTEANLTYGPALAMVLGALIARADVRVGDVFHVSGHPPARRFSYSLQLAAAYAVPVRVVTVAGLLFGGAIHPASAATALAGGVLTGAFVLGQARLLAAYVVAAAMGTLIGWAGRSAATALGWVGLATVPYTPFFGSLANRAPHLLDVLPYGPFGALRAALSGNGGVFGDDPSHARPEHPGIALVVLAGWLVVIALPSILRGRAAPLRVAGRALPVAGSLTVAAVMGAAAPSALADGIPWRWQPSWRHAEAAGWDSRQVTLRWIGDVRAGRSDATLFADPAYATTVDPEVLAAVKAAGTVSVPAESELRTPDVTVVSLVFTPPLASGNVEVTRAELQLGFTLTDGRWLIAGIAGPQVAARVTS